MFVKVKRVMTLAFLLFLLFAFTVPRSYLNRCCDELLALANRASAAESPALPLDEMAALYEKKSRVLRMFINHGAVEAVSAAVAAARPLKEKEALESALSVLRSAIEGLRSIESLCLDGLC